MKQKSIVKSRRIVIAKNPLRKYSKSNIKLLLNIPNVIFLEVTLTGVNISRDILESPMI